MDSQTKMKAGYVAIVFFLAVCFSNGVLAYNTYIVQGSTSSYQQPYFVSLDHGRAKRDVAAIPQPAPAPTAATTTAHASDDSNRTINTTTISTIMTTSPVAAVTQIPLLGQNGTGILRVNTTNTPKVSEPIPADDNLNMFNESPETMKTEQNITEMRYDNHDFYNSTFIVNATYFNQYWAEITNHTADVHGVLSNSHRRATTLRLTFEFPFYGHPLRNITVATGGFIYTGEHVHNWLAATQYIAPLMANFDTTLTNDSYVKMYDDGEKFTAFWENVTLQEDVTKKFTFAVTLIKNGDIVFAYKSIPIPIVNINDSEHPVKVGISDAYLTDRILFLVRRKTIYEYHRVTFKSYEITNGTILRLTALPTCLQYDSCESCVNHETGFDCKWCEAIQKCSSGTDRNKQDWMLRHCDKTQISNETECPVRAHVEPGANAGNTAYVTDTHPGVANDAVVNNMPPQVQSAATPQPRPLAPEQVTSIAAHTPIGSVVGIFIVIALISSFAAWTLYAFKNPHTRSGQFLIKYRPSQWSWRRGEARYTAATIHM